MVNNVNAINPITLKRKFIMLLKIKKKENAKRIKNNTSECLSESN